MKQRGIKHPLSHIFTAEEFHYQKAEMAVLFKNCYVNDRFYYPSVQWDIRRNILRFNRKNGNRDIKCVKLSIFNCDKEQEIIDPSESHLFTDTCKNFFNDLKVKYTNNIKHLELRKFKTNPKIIGIIGQSSSNDALVSKQYFTDFLNFFNSFCSSPGMVVDLFTEININIGHTSSKNNYLETSSKIYERLLYSLNDSSCVRVHKIQFSLTRSLTPLIMLEKYLQSRINNVKNKKLDVTSIMVFVQNSLPLFDRERIVTSFPILMKQFIKIDKIDLLVRIFNKKFTSLYDRLLDITESKNLARAMDDLYNTDLLKIKSDGKLRIRDILDSFSDIYTIGRLLKPGYNYCVFLGDSKRSRNILEILSDVGIETETILKS